jgi:signal transduction histidine kinase
VSRRLVFYVGSVVAIAIFLLALHPVDWRDPFLMHFLGWVAICFLAETLWLPTASGEGTDSMASAANFATVVLWGVSPAIWIVAISTMFSDLFVRRRPGIRVLFNTAAMVVVMAVGGWVFTLLGGPAKGLWAQLSPTLRPDPQGLMALLVPLVVLGLVYRAVNVALVSVASAWSSDRPILRVVKEDFLYAEQIISDLALLFLSPLMVASFVMLWYPGIILFYVPLLVIRDSHRRYVELKKAQAQLIHTERMAAKGEMAAEIGHELSNMLGAISGRAQMLVMELGKGETGKIERHAKIIVEQAANMAIQAKGLMDFSHKDKRVSRIDMNDLIRRTVEFVRPQNKYDGVEFELILSDNGLPAIIADPAQLQQVFTNLFSNAADAMGERMSPQKKITVHTGWQDAGETVLVQIADTGPGINRVHLERIWDPQFSTKQTGHGFGLATCYRIVSDHRGRIWAESDVGRGATFNIVLPIGPQAGW